MDTEAWLRLVQLIIGAGGLIAVILTLQQKTNSVTTAANGGDDSPGR